MEFPTLYQFDQSISILGVFGGNLPFFQVLTEHTVSTKSGWITGKTFLDPMVPPGPPPLGHDLDDQMKISSDMFYIFHLWEDTHSLVKNSLKLTL